MPKAASTPIHARSTSTVNLDIPSANLTPRSKKPSKGAKKRAKATGEIIDLTLDDDGELVDLKLSGEGSLQTPQAGPSRLRDEVAVDTPPSTFQAIPRSLLSGLSRRPSLSPVPSDTSRLSVKRKAKSRSKSPLDDGIIDVTPASPGRQGVTNGDHFDPPALFTTSLMPEIRQTAEGAVLELKKPEDIAKATDTNPSSSLLLPDHVLLDDDDTPQTLNPTTNIAESSMTGLHFLDADTMRGVSRYFDDEAEGEEQTEEATFLAQADSSKLCSNCKRPGHRRQNCPHFTCTVCGQEDDHERRDCPVTLICYGCGNRGHRFDRCPNPLPSSERRKGCDRCGAHDHFSNTCPSLWRVYAYRSPKSREETMAKRQKLVGWAREAAGGDPYAESCYNCSKDGHLGDDCPNRRHSLAKLYTPSPFSQNMVSRGPFYDARVRTSGDPKHARWDEDGSLLPGVKVFEGAKVGERGREKRKQTLVADSMRGARDDDEDEDWFRGNGSARRGGISIRGRGRGGLNTPVGNRIQKDRPWDSDTREKGRNRGGLPFGHGHLMDSAPAKMPAAQTKGIQFGKLGLDTPTGGSKYRQNGQDKGNDDSGVDTPGKDKDKRVKNKVLGNPALAVVNRALGLNGDNNTPKSKKKKRIGPGSESGSAPSTPVAENRNGHGNADGDVNGNSSSRRRNKRKNAGGGDGKDWENEWRSGGNGGGPVAGWGREYDEEERKGRNSAKRQAQAEGTGQKVKQGRGGGGKEVDGRSGGQRYTGGY